MLTGKPPLSVVIPTRDAADSLARTLDTLASARASGLLLEVVVVDGGSVDGTAPLARARGAHVLEAPRGRGVQLAEGARAAQGEWLLFLHADTVLEDGWVEAARAFMAAPGNGRRAAAFRLVLDDPVAAARRVERLAHWRARRLGLAYGDQGLLLSHAFYAALGGYARLPLMEDVDLVRRIGRRRLSILDVGARTSAARYRQDGWWARPMRNLLCLALFFAGVPPARLVALYRGRRA